MLLILRKAFDDCCWNSTTRNEIMGIVYSQISMFHADLDPSTLSLPRRDYSKIFGSVSHIRLARHGKLGYRTRFQIVWVTLSHVEASEHDTELRCVKPQSEFSECPSRVGCQYPLSVSFDKNYETNNSCRFS